MTHAFFKAQLFLGSGSVIHGTGTQDIREMGGLQQEDAVDLLDVPDLHARAVRDSVHTAGGCSKEEILTVAFHTNKIVFCGGRARRVH